jgi:hypothetical protein
MVSITSAAEMYQYTNEGTYFDYITIFVHKYSSVVEMTVFENVGE